MGSDMSFGNPLLKKLDRSYSGEPMTRAGTSMWTLLFLVVLIGAAVIPWMQFSKAIGDFDTSTLQRVQVGVDEDDEAIMEVRVVDPETGAQSAVPHFDLSSVHTLMLIGALGGFVVALMVIFMPKTAPLLGFVYAGLEGLAVGAFSATFEFSFPGITMQAAAATFGVAVVMWVLYSTGVIKVTGGFVAFVISMMLGILLLYLVDIGVSIYIGKGLDIVHGNSWMSIIVSFVIVGVASLNYAIDYAHIDEAVKAGAPKYMEAYCAFSLIVTTVWCYMEIVRLIAKLRSKKLRSNMWVRTVAQGKKGVDALRILRPAQYA